MLKRIVTKLKNLFKTFFKKKEEERAAIQENITIVIHRKNDVIEELRSSDKNQVENYSKLLKYIDFYDFESVYDLESGFVDIYLQPRKHDYISEDIEN